MYTLHDAVWKILRPLGILLELCARRGVEYIDTVGQNSTEGNATFLVLFFVYFADDGSRRIFFFALS